VADFAREVRRRLDDGESLADVLGWLNGQRAPLGEIISALRSTTPLTAEEAKSLIDSGRSLEAITADRLSLLRLAPSGELLGDWFRRAILGGHRWLTAVPAPSGFDFWWKPTRGRVPEGSWSGQLPSLQELTANFRALLAAQPRLARYIEISAARADLLQLHFRLDGDA
jgi:hypothetical protein